MSDPDALIMFRDLLEKRFSGSKAEARAAGERLAELVKDASDEKLSWFAECRPYFLGSDGASPVVVAAKNLLHLKALRAVYQWQGKTRKK